MNCSLLPLACSLRLPSAAPINQPPHLGHGCYLITFQHWRLGFSSIPSGRRGLKWRIIKLMGTSPPLFAFSLPLASAGFCFSLVGITKY